MCLALRLQAIISMRKKSADRAEQEEYMKIKTNPDKEHVAEIRKALKENQGYCPCAVTKNEDTRCMCRDFREMQSGMCHCGLYIKEE